MQLSSPNPSLDEKLPATLLDPTEIEEIALPYWRRLFDTIGYPEGLKPSSLRHESIVAALASGKVPPKLVEALETIRELGEASGQDALIDSLADAGVVDQGQENEGPKEFALRLFIEQQKKPELERAMLCALASVYERGGRRSLQEFVGKEPRAIQDVPEKEEQLRDEVAMWCAANGMEDYAQVRAFRDEDGGLHFLVVHGHRIETPVTIQEGARKVTRIRRAIFDSIRYDPRTGRIKIGARTNLLAGMYQTLCGRVFFGDQNYFAFQVPCTLQPLQRKGQDALDNHRVCQVASATLREAVWDIGGDRITVKARDCFKRSESSGLSKEEAVLIEAKIELRIQEKRSRRISVTVKAPSRIDFRHDKYEGIVEQYLEEIGVRLPAPANERKDLWDLYSWEHRESVWRGAYADVDRMKTAEILVPTGLRAVNDDEGIPGNLVIEPVGVGEWQGAPQSPGTRGRALTATDISGLRLDVLRLAGHIASGIGAEGGVKELANGVIDLGTRSLVSSKFRAFIVSRAPTDPAALAAVVQHAARGAAPVLMVPMGRTTGTGFAQVELNVMSPPFDLLAREVIHALHLEDEAPAALLANPGDRLIIDSAYGKAWLDGVDLQLDPENHPFKFLHRLAAARGRPLANETFSKEVSYGSHGDPTVAKQAKHDVLKKIRAAFAAAGKETPADLGTMILSKSGGYQLHIPAFVR